MSGRAALVVAIAAGVSAAIGGLAVREWTRPVRPTELRVGYYNFIPYLMVNEDGSPGGFGVEVFAEAARREGMVIRWVNTEGSPDQAFADGRIDLYPMLAITEARQRRISFSRPWWENNLGLMSRTDNVVDRARLGQGDTRVAVLDLSFGVTLFTRAFPEATVVGFAREVPVVESVCLGQADAAMLDVRSYSLIRERVPSCHGIPLTFRWFRELNLTYGVGAQPGLEDEAARLHQAIVALALDGTMTEIGERWGVQATNQMTMFRDLVAMRDRNTALGVTAVVLALIVGVFAWQNRRVRHARVAAEQASRAKNQFLASVSHEIRTPLNGILGMTELLLGTRLDGPQREFVHALEASGRALVTVIDDVLDFAKIESGTLTTRVEAFDLVSLAEDVVTLFAGRAAAKHLDIATTADAEVPAVVLADAGRVRQVLSNLVGNAVKFTDAGTVLVTVARVPSDGDDLARVRLAVADTGAGVPDDQQAKLFLPFSQLDTSTRRRHGGTGLGLAICRELVALMGGTIGMHRNEAGGSTFWFELPVGPDTGQRDDRTVTHEGPVVQFLQGAATATAVDVLLARWGVAVVRVGDVDACLQALAVAPAAVLLIDMARIDTMTDEERARLGAVVMGEHRPHVLLATPGQVTAERRAGICPHAIVASLPVRRESLRLALDEAAPGPGATRQDALATHGMSDVPAATLNARVLVADDNAINRRVVEGMLRRLGCSVTLADNGREAVDAVQRDVFDLVLMDCQMPEMDGFEATRAIRAGGRQRDVAVLALTATALPTLREACAEAGMDAVLTKPCTIEAIRQAVETWAGRGAAGEVS